jgi:hypothetical protein
LALQVQVLPKCLNDLLTALALEGVGLLKRQSPVAWLFGCVLCVCPV